MSNLINPFQPKLSSQQEIVLIKNDLATMRNIISQVITGIICLTGYETIESDFELIKKVIEENNIKYIDMKDIPECLSTQFTESQIALYSMNVLKNILIGAQENILTQDKNIN